MRVGLFAASLLMMLAACSTGPLAQPSPVPNDVLLSKLEADLESFVHQLEVQLSQIQALTEQIEKLRSQLARTENERKQLARQIEIYQGALKKPKQDW